MIARALQTFSVALLLGATAFAATPELQVGSVYDLSFHDVDGNDLSTAAGRITIITVVTRENEDGAHAVADRVPDRYLGDPKSRYITLVNFQGKLAGPLQGLTRSIIRGRLDAEARELKPKYVAKQITRDPRKDVYVVADFKGDAVKRLGLAPESSSLFVCVFDGHGKLIARWNEVPPGDSLAQALTAAE